MDILPKLSTTKGNDGKTSLLHFLASLSYKEEEVPFYDEITSVSAATRVSNEVLQMQFKEMAHQIAHFGHDLQQTHSDAYKQQLQVFYEKSISKQVDIEKLMDQYQDEFLHVLLHFGEEAAMKSNDEQFYLVITEFVTSYKKAVHDNKERDSRLRKQSTQKKKQEVDTQLLVPAADQENQAPSNLLQQQPTPKKSPVTVATPTSSKKYSSNSPKSATPMNKPTVAGRMSPSLLSPRSPLVAIQLESKGEKISPTRLLQQQQKHAIKDHISSQMQENKHVTI